MMRYSIEPRDQIFVKGYRFLSFGKNIGKNLSRKYSQHILIRLNNPPQVHLKLLNKAIQKTAEAIGDLISNKIADNITKV